MIFSFPHATVLFRTLNFGSTPSSTLFAPAIAPLASLNSSLANLQHTHLWANTTTATFSAQVVDCGNLDGYLFVDIYYFRIGSERAYLYTRIPVGSKGLLLGVIPGSSATRGAYAMERSVNVLSGSSGISFANAYFTYTGQSATVMNDYLIPIHIYGIKG